MQRRHTDGCYRCDCWCRTKRSRTATSYYRGLPARQTCFFSNKKYTSKVIEFQALIQDQETESDTGKL